MQNIDPPSPIKPSEKAITIVMPKRKNYHSNVKPVKKDKKAEDT